MLHRGTHHAALQLRPSHQVFYVQPLFSGALVQPSRHCWTEHQYFGDKAKGCNPCPDPLSEMWTNPKSLRHIHQLHLNKTAKCALPFGSAWVLCGSHAHGSGGAKRGVLRQSFLLFNQG